jgi:hypothetical protein
MFKLLGPMLILLAAGDATPAPTPDPPTPATTTIRVINDTAKPVTLDRSFGPAEPFGIKALDGDLGEHVTLDEQDDDRSGNWVEMCECACGPTPCPECEAPPNIEVVLAPGEAYELPWSGKLRREVQHPMGGTCFETFDPPAGRYQISACTMKKKCGKTRVELPAASPIEIHLRGSPPA